MAVDTETGKLAGFINGAATKENRFSDGFFTNAEKHDPNGCNIMILGVDVLPEHQHKGLGKALMASYCQREKKREVSLLIPGVGL